MKKYLLKYFIIGITISLVLPTVLFSHSRDPMFTQVSVEQGLSNVAVFSITQDATGFLWFGTADGLNKYDGQRFTIFSSSALDSNSLSGDSILALCLQDSQTLWVGTSGSGLNRFNPMTGEVQRYSHQNNVPLNLHHTDILDLACDLQGRLWIGTPQGLTTLDTQTGEFKSANHLLKRVIDKQSFYIRELYIDDNQRLWIGTAGDGLLVYHPEKDSVQTLFKTDYPEIHTIHAIYRDTNGIYWIGTNAGLVRLNSDTGRTHRYLHNDFDSATLASDIVLSVCEDYIGNKKYLWIGTKNGGINQLDMQENKIARHTCGSNTLCCLGSNIINKVFQDRSGVVWFGTDCCGLNKYTGEEMHFLKLEDMLNLPRGWEQSRVWAFHQDIMDDYWVATADGLKRIDKHSKKIKRYLHDPENPESLSDNAVTTIFEDRQNNLWVGTESGLNQFERSDNQFQIYRHSPFNPFSLSDNGIVSLADDKNGNLWIGTRMGGVNKFELSTGKIYPIEPGL
ncbi:MAG: hypothetical protein E4H13_14510, partial [Calditrichales bacterium]